MKKMLLCLLALCLCLPLAACKDDEWHPRYADLKLTKYVTLPDFADITLDTAEVDKRVNVEVASICAQIGMTWHTTGTLQTGDILTIDYVGVLAGETEPFEGGTMLGAQLTLGSGEYIEGFESGLIGKQAGETVTLNLTFPEDYFEIAMRGKDVTFTVTILGYLREGVSEVLTDHLVMEYTRGEYMSAAEYIAELRAFHVEIVALEQILEAATIKRYPTDELEELYDDFYTEISATYQKEASGYATYSIYTFADYVASPFLVSGWGEKYGFTEPFSSLDAFEDALYETAKRELRGQLVLAAIGQRENITVSEELYIAEANKVAVDVYGLADYTELERYFSREDIYQGVWFDLIYDYIGTQFAED